MTEYSQGVLLVSLEERQLSHSTQTAPYPANMGKLQGHCRWCLWGRAQLTGKGQMQRSARQHLRQLIGLCSHCWPRWIQMRFSAKETNIKACLWDLPFRGKHLLQPSKDILSPQITTSGRELWIGRSDQQSLKSDSEISIWGPPLGKECLNWVSHHL